MHAKQQSQSSNGIYYNQLLFLNAFLLMAKQLLNHT